MYIMFVRQLRLAPDKPDEWLPVHGGICDGATRLEKLINQ
jgi:hypothetical protein